MNTLTITRLPALDYTSNESLNTLSTNISFAGKDMRRIMLTSCQPQEGKSYLSMNLMRTLAGVGKSVVLVDADLRKSVLVGQYGIEAVGGQITGLSHYLAGLCSREDILYATNIERADMILAGKDVINSLPLLSTPRFSMLLEGLAQMYDIVLVDAPPIGVLIDAAQIARSCDGVIFVVTSNEISRKELIDAKRQIENTGCPILGAVLNKVSFDTRSAKKYYHRTYYMHYNTAYYQNKPKRRERNKQKQGKG